MYKPFNTVIIRSPLLPYKFLKHVLDSSELSSVLNNELIMEAIFLSSPEFYNELKNMIRIRKLS